MSLWRDSGENIKDWVFAVTTIAIGVVLGVLASIFVWFAWLV